MQSSGQQPKEKIERENAEVEGTKDQAALPLYEFPADQQGMVYPPPPSYYQNMQIPAERPALPLQPGIPGKQAQLNTMGVQVPPSSQCIILRCKRRLKSPTNGFGLSFRFSA